MSRFEGKTLRELQAMVETRRQKLAAVMTEKRTTIGQIISLEELIRKEIGE